MSKSIEQRAVAAVKAVAVARAEVEQLTKAIGAELAKCPGVKGGLVFVHEPGRTPFQIDPEDITHLKLAYTPEVRDSEFGRHDYMDDDEIDYYLSEECQHCLSAHGLVRQRRIARQKHGRAKATVTKLGRELMKGGK